MCRGFTTGKCHAQEWHVCALTALGMVAAPAPSAHCWHQLALGLTQPQKAAPLVTNFQHKMSGFRQKALIYHAGAGGQRSLPAHTTSTSPGTPPHSCLHAGLRAALPGLRAGEKKVPQGGSGAGGSHGTAQGKSKEAKLSVSVSQTENPVRSLRGNPQLGQK